MWSVRLSWIDVCSLLSSRSGGRLYLQTRGSKFMKYQELKIQECVSVEFIATVLQLSDHQWHASSPTVAACTLLVHVMIGAYGY